MTRDPVLIGRRCLGIQCVVTTLMKVWKVTGKRS